MVVPGRTAAEFDLAGRFAWLLSVVMGLIAFVAGRPVSIVLAILALALVVVAVLLGVRSSRVARLEKDAGYSTLFDFAGYESRHPRTKQLLRAADDPPASPGRRSLLRSMLAVKPGTVLAKRLEEDDEG